MIDLKYKITIEDISNQKLEFLGKVLQTEFGSERSLEIYNIFKIEITNWIRDYKAKGIKPKDYHADICDRIWQLKYKLQKKYKKDFPLLGYYERYNLVKLYLEDRLCLVEKLVDFATVPDIVKKSSISGKANEDENRS